MASVKSRPYRTRIRRGEAPARICAAARELFVANGYAATSIDDIAAAAGVARPTIFTAVGPKPAILKAVVDQAVTGDAEPATLADRAWYQEAFDEPNPRRSVELHARNMTWIGQRMGPLLRALESAAAVDADAASLWAEHQQQRRAGLTNFARSLAKKTKLRVDTATAADTMWTLQPAAYLRLVEDAGWTVDRYQRWLTDVLLRLLLD